MHTHTNTTSPYSVYEVLLLYPNTSFQGDKQQILAPQVLFGKVNTIHMKQQILNPWRTSR